MIYFVLLPLFFTAALLTILACRLLSKKGWFKGFCVGFLAFFSFYLSISIILFAFKLTHFNEVGSKGEIASVRITRMAPQKYQVSIKSFNASDEQKYIIYGDAIQFSVENSRLDKLLDENFVALHFLKAKYYSIEQQEKQSASLKQLNQDNRFHQINTVLNKLMPFQLSTFKKTPFYTLKESQFFVVKLYNGKLILKEVLTSSPV